MPLKALVITKTAGYRHTSIPAALDALCRQASESRIYSITATEDVDAQVTEDALQAYDVVILLQTTGDFLDEAHLDALQRFVRRGGGVVGIHAAAAGMLSDDWYGRLMGAHFHSHPEPERGTVIAEPAPLDDGTDGFQICPCREDVEDWMDEWYNFTTHPRQNANLRILMRGDTGTFAGSMMGDDHPLVWYQEFEGGRSFYTALGHFDEAYGEDWFMDMILRAIVWTGRYEAKWNHHVPQISR